MPKPPRSRNVDFESTKPRVQRSTKRRQPAPEPKDETDYESQSDSSIESELDMPVKDDSRRTRAQRPSARKVRQSEQQPPVEESAEQPSSHTETSVHMLITGALYHLSFAPIVQTRVSTFKPSAFMLFETLRAMHALTASNTYLSYVCPAYVTVASSLYYGIMFHIQVLRAMTVANTINGLQSSVLRRFLRTYPLEQLPCASPLVAYFQTLGAIRTSDPMFSYITPTLPDELGTPTNSTGCYASAEVTQLPCVPALSEFVRLLGRATTPARVFTTERELFPVRREGTNTFLGINIANDLSQSPEWTRLSYGAGWNLPSETQSDISAAKLTNINRWRIPEITLATNLGPIDSWLNLSNSASIEWFKNLAHLAGQEARFFKGSTNFSNIGDQSTLASLVECHLGSSLESPPSAENEIYPKNRTPLSANANTTRGETSPEVFRLGAVTQINSIFSTHFLPAEANGRPNRSSSGPYFHLNDDETNTANLRLFQIQSLGDGNPSLLLNSLIQSKMYDQTGGQSTQS